MNLDNFKNNSNILFFGGTKADNYHALQDTVGQNVIFYQANNNILCGIQVGNLQFGDTKQFQTANFTLPPDGTFYLRELQSRAYSRIGYIKVDCDGEYSCGSDQYIDTRILTNLKVKFAGIGFDGGPGNGSIQQIAFTLVQ